MVASVRQVTAVQWLPRLPTRFIPQRVQLLFVLHLVKALMFPRVVLVTLVILVPSCQSASLHHTILARAWLLVRSLASSLRIITHRQCYDFILKTLKILSTKNSHDFFENYNHKCLFHMQDR